MLIIMKGYGKSKRDKNKNVKNIFINFKIIIDTCKLMKYNENAQRKKKVTEKIVYFYKENLWKKTLENFVPKHSFLVCIDSVAVLCVMEVKHKECFCPATVNDWDFTGSVQICQGSVGVCESVFGLSWGINRFLLWIKY